MDIIRSIDALWDEEEYIFADNSEEMHNIEFNGKKLIFICKASHLVSSCGNYFKTGCLKLKRNKRGTASLSCFWFQDGKLFREDDKPCHLEIINNNFHLADWRYRTDQFSELAIKNHKTVFYIKCVGQDQYKITTFNGDELVPRSHPEIVNLYENLESYK